MGVCTSKSAVESKSEKKSSKDSAQKESETKIELAFKAKRANVFSKGVNIAKKEETEATNLKVIPKTPEQTQFILDALSKIYVFATLSQDDLFKIVDAMDFQNFKKGENIMVQGQEGDFYYILNEGKVSIISNGNNVASLGRGASFGELALLYNSPRTATVQCETDCVLFTLDRATFRFTIAQEADSRTKAIIDSLKKVEILADLNNDQLHKLAEVVEIVHYNSGDEIIRKGTEGNIFYMIKKGAVFVSDIGDKFSDFNLTEGNYFGERALMTGEPRKANITAITDCELFALDRTTFTQFLGPLKDLLDHNMNMRVLGSIKMFEKLTVLDRAKIAKSFELRRYPDKAKIINEGDKGQTFYIIKIGEVNVFKGETKVATLRVGQYFGEMALLSDERRTASIVAWGACECFELDRATFNRLQSSLQHVFDNEASTRKEQLNSLKSTGSNQGDHTLAGLQTLALIGSGTFGRVTLVTDKRSKALFALKTMLKSEVRGQNQITNVMNEKTIMEQCLDSPFIIRLYQTFADSKKIYLLLEFVQGGELFNVIHTSDSDGINDPHACFYSAGLLEALNYLHSKNIAYRDTKPENCLIDKFGYPKLIDFGFAKVIHQKSFTLCGTPEYLAPELVLGRGHNKSVDYWALGVLIFEMLAGQSPFSDPRDFDQVTICKNIVANQPKFPRAINADCKDLIKKLLASNSQQRLGNMKGGIEDIYNHKWFKGFQFENFRAKTLRAPWIPPVNSPTDTSNYIIQGLEHEHMDPGVDIADDWGF